MKVGTTSRAMHPPAQFNMSKLKNGEYVLTLTENVTPITVYDNNGETTTTHVEYEYKELTAVSEIDGYESAVDALTKLKYSDNQKIEMVQKGMDNRENSEYTAYLNYVNECKAYAREFFGIEQTAEEIAKENAEKYIPAAYTSMIALAKTLLASSPVQDDNEKITLSGLYEEWSLGNYSVGDIRNYGGQTWECFQAHDNAIYQDINPDNESTWRTFWRPLHGKTIETARPFTPVTNATDTYKAGEYMVFTDGKIYKCLSETAYSPTEYAAAWEVVNNE